VSPSATAYLGLEFVQRFGGSCRTKHLVRQPDSLSGILAYGWATVRGRLAGESKRVYPWPAHSELPGEFIRLDPWEAQYVFTVAKLARHGIVEIGRYQGGSTFLLAFANREVPIWSIDKDAVDDSTLSRTLEGIGIGANVELLTGSSYEDEFPGIGVYDLLFIDGNHSYRAVTGDLERFYPLMSPGGNVLLHDCWDETVQQAVRDFVAKTPDVQIVRSPYVPAAHWLTEYGSIGHLRKA
jgi:hypothetical protein